MALPSLCLVTVAECFTLGSTTQLGKAKEDSNVITIIDSDKVHLTYLLAKGVSVQQISHSCNDAANPAHAIADLDFLGLVLSAKSMKETLTFNSCKLLCM